MKVRRSLFFARRAAPAVAVAALVLAMGGSAHAQDCSTLPKPVYVTGSTAVKPFLAAVAAQLVGLADPITVVYQAASGSCDGPTALSTSPVGTIAGTASVWTTDGMEGSCTLSTTGDPVDIGTSDVAASTCGVTVPADVKDFLGPVQAMTFIVPKDSTQTAISGEAAYLVFGLGAAGEVSPWNDETLVEQRNDKSGTQRMIGAFIKVPAGKFKGHVNAKSGDVITSLTASAAAGNADKAIGILSTDAADKNRATLKVLAYQHFGQDCGYWPDSDPASFDKANVRDGHYNISGSLHMLAKTSGGVVSNENAKKIIDYLSGAADAGFDLLKVEAKGGVVPDCAMRVKHASDGGALMSYMPDKSCECKFITEATGTKPDSCTMCSAAGDCPKSAPACNFGYCEVK